MGFARNNDGTFEKLADPLPKGDDPPQQEETDPPEKKELTEEEKELEEEKRQKEIRDARQKQIAQNRKSGKAQEIKCKNDLVNAGDKDIVEQITLKSPVTGTKTKLDFISTGANGNIKLTESKGSQTAPLTKNQKKAFPEIETGGAEVISDGKPPYKAGQKIPPTKVNIVRP